MSSANSLRRSGDAHLPVSAGARRVVLASNNAGKARELGQLLAGTPWEVLPQSSFGVSDVEETGLSFVENAILKARHAANQTGLPTLADDSGLEVDALGGAPGIYSARYAGPGASDRANLMKLLAELGDRPADHRRARFHCCIVYMRRQHDPTPLVCQGSWEGSILFEPAGDNGFGYDPVFYIPEHRCSAAQLPSLVKNSVSHRGQALRRMIQALRHL